MNELLITKLIKHFYEELILQMPENILYSLKLLKGINEFSRTTRRGNSRVVIVTAQEVSFSDLVLSYDLFKLLQTLPRGSEVSNDTEYALLNGSSTIHAHYSRTNNDLVQ